MRITIFGLGYVGCVSMACLAELGHLCIGLDVSKHKVDLINRGEPTIVEKDIDVLIAKHCDLGNVSASLDAQSHIQQSDVSIICVGTPNTTDGSLNLSDVFNCAKQIGEALKEKQGFHTVVIRSTVTPGTNQQVGEFISAASGKTIDQDFGVVSNPEFLREGTAINDYFNPPVTVLGSTSRRALEVMKEIYKDLTAEIVETEIGVAEIIKYVNNSYHALKITFANEVGNVCKKLNIDSHKVMDVFCKDKQLNISDYYFKPGLAYGGSCLPKDLAAMVNLSEYYSLEANVLSSIKPSNEYQKKIAYNIIKSTKKKKIGIIGISFKQGTDDLRFSPMVDILKWLIEEGFDVSIYDKSVATALLIGANKDFVDVQVPGLSSIMVRSLNEIFELSEAVVLSQKSQEVVSLIEQYQDRIIIDFARIDSRSSSGNYIGLCW